MVRKIRAKLVLRLRAEGRSGRAIAASQGMSRRSVTAVLEAADAAGVGWDDVADLDDRQVYALVFPGRGEHESVFAQPDWDRVHQEMARQSFGNWQNGIASHAPQQVRTRNLGRFPSGVGEESSVSSHQHAMAPNGTITGLQYREYPAIRNRKPQLA